ncbi:MAG: hypothetical protein RLZZ618_866 [Pseudomonadota bacterium]|jgi:hypothetical protein
MTLPKFLIPAAMAIGVASATVGPTAPAHAAPHVANIGATDIVLPLPPGFVEASAVSPDTWAKAEKAAPADSRLIGVFIEEGQPVAGRSMQRYFLLHTTRSLEGTAVTADEFGQVKPTIRKKFDDLAADVKDVSGPFGVFNDVKTSLSVLSITPATASANRVAYSVTTAVVKGKMLDMYVYSTYRDERDAAWVREATLKWLPRLQASNR